MRKKVIEHEARTTATAHEVFELLAEGATWPTWSGIDSFDLQQEGDTGGESLNAVRVFHTGRTNSVERIVELVPDRRFSYALLSGLPLREYRADVDLTPVDGGTTIRWRSTFYPERRGTGWLYRLVLGRFIKGCVQGLAAYATEQHSTTVGPGRT